MKRWLIALGFLLALTASAAAQCNGQFSALRYCGTGASGGPPGQQAFTNIFNNLPLANGDIYVGNASNIATARAPSGSGDCTFTFTNLGVFGYTCLKTNGVAFGSLATQSSVLTGQLPAPFTNGTASGNSAQFATVLAGTKTANHVATWDANGNIQDGGAATGTVTNVATGGIATGGPITSTGTITVTAAVKSDQTTATSTTVAVVPGVQQFHPSALKAVGYATISGTTLTDHSPYNATFSRTGVGLYTLTFGNGFANTNFSCVITAIAASSASVFLAEEIGTRASGNSISIFVSQATAFGAADPAGIEAHCAGLQ